MIWEIIIIALSICLFLVGVFSDYSILILQHEVTFYVDDLSGLSLCLLQIQSTVITLTIAVIALIAGSNSETYLGISVSEYYFSDRPWCLKQIVISIINIITLAFCIFAHIKEWYNIVICCTFSQLLFIILAIIDIFKAFNDKHSRRDEFKAYYNYVLKSGNKKKIKSLVLNLKDEFILKEIDMSRPEFELYEELYWKGFYAYNVLAEEK